MDTPVVRDLLARHNIRCTRQRERVYAALWASQSHPTAEELCQAVRRTAPEISLATIYNTLETFTKHGLCRKIAPAQAEGGGGANAYRYDADVADHAHLVMRSGSVRDLPEDLNAKVLAAIPRGLLSEVEARMGVRLGRLSVEFMEDADRGLPERAD